MDLLSVALNMEEASCRLTSLDGVLGGVKNGLAFSLSATVWVESRPVPLIAAAVSALIFILRETF